MNDIYFYCVDRSIIISMFATALMFFNIGALTADSKDFKAFVHFSSGLVFLVINVAIAVTWVRPMKKSLQANQQVIYKSKVYDVEQVPYYKLERTDLILSIDSLELR